MAKKSPLEKLLAKLTPEERQAIIREHYRQGGLKGGAKMKERGTNYFKEIGKKGAKKRWKNHVKKVKPVVDDEVFIPPAITI